jgi:hypothetical protein
MTNMASSENPTYDLVKIIDSYFNTSDSKKKVELVQKLIEAIKIPQFALLIQNNKDISSRVDIIVEEAWTRLKLWDSNIYKSLSTINPSSVVLQNFYTKSLSNEKDMLKCRAFLNSKIVLFNNREILDNVFEIAKISEQWDFAALLLSSNGILDDEIYNNYLKANSYIIDKQIISNLKSKRAKRELMHFMRQLTFIEPKNQEYLLEYFDTLKENKEIPALNSLLNTLNPEDFSDEMLILKLGKLYMESDDYAKAQEQAERILKVSSENQEALEIYVDALHAQNKWELLISFLNKRRSIILNSSKLLEFFMEASVQLKNYRDPLEIINSFSVKTKPTLKTKILMGQIYIFEGNIKKAKNILSEIPLNGEFEKELTALKVQIYSLEKNVDLYISEGLKYLNLYPENSRFLKEFLSFLESLNLWDKIIEIEDIKGIDASKQDLKLALCKGNFYLGNFLRVSAILVGMDFQYFDDTLHKAILTNTKNNDAWIGLFSEKNNFSTTLNAYLGIMKNFNSGETLKEVDIKNVESQIEGKVLSIIIRLDRAFKSIEKTNIRNEFSAIFSEIDNICGIKGDADAGLFNFPKVRFFIETQDFDEALRTLNNSADTRNPYFGFYSSMISIELGSEKIRSVDIDKFITTLSAAPFYGKKLELAYEHMNISEILDEIERLVNHGSSQYVPWAKLYNWIKREKSESLLNFIDLLEFSQIVRVETLRILRDVRKKEQNGQQILQIDQEICHCNGKTNEDILNFLLDIKDYGNKKMLSDAVLEYSSVELTPELNLVFGDYYLSNNDPETAEHFYNKIVSKELAAKAKFGLTEAIIEQGRFTEAEKMIQTLRDSSSLKLKLYLLSGDIDKLEKTLKGINNLSEEVVLILESIVDKYWENKVVRSQLLGLVKRTNNATLGLDIASRLSSDRKVQEGLELLKVLFKNNPEDLSVATVLIDKLASFGKFEEANIAANLFIKTGAKDSDKKEVFAKILRLDFNNGLFKQIIKYYESFSSLVNEDSAEVIALTLIQLEEYRATDEFLSNQHQRSLSHEKFENLINIMKRSVEESEIVSLAEKLMRASLKYHRSMDKKEAVVFAKIKASRVDSVFNFINEPSSFIGIDQDFLEEESKRILKNIYKKTGLLEIEQLTLPLFFLGNGSKNIKNAKLIRDYVDDIYYNYKTKQIPKEQQIVSLIPQAAALSNTNPMIYSIKFDLGIKGSMRLRTAIESLDGEFL